MLIGRKLEDLRGLHVYRERKFETRKISRRQFVQPSFSLILRHLWRIYTYGKTCKVKLKARRRGNLFIVGFTREAYFVASRHAKSRDGAFTNWLQFFIKLCPSQHAIACKSSCKSVLYSAAVFLLKWENEIFYFFLHLVKEYYIVFLHKLSCEASFLSQTYMRKNEEWSEIFSCLFLIIIYLQLFYTFLKRRMHMSGESQNCF